MKWKLSRGDQRQLSRQRRGGQEPEQHDRARSRTGGRVHPESVSETTAGLHAPVDAFGERPARLRASHRLLRAGKPLVTMAPRPTSANHEQRGGCGCQRGKPGKRVGVGHGILSFSVSPQEIANGAQKTTTTNERPCRGPIWRSSAPAPCLPEPVVFSA